MNHHDHEPEQPVRLIIRPDTAQPARVSLIDWIHQQPRYRTTVRDTRRQTGGHAGFSDAVIIAVVAHALLPGLFSLLQTWLEQQRRDASVRVQVGDTEVELNITGRSDTAALVAQATQALAAARAEQPDAGDDAAG